MKVPLPLIEYVASPTKTPGTVLTASSPSHRVVDGGGNPDTLTRLMLSAARGRNEDMRGKLQAATLLRAHLADRSKAWEDIDPAHAALDGPSVKYVAFAG